MSAWIHTATGRPFYFANPHIEPAHLFSEVAHGLAQINRFAGQTQVPISVAQHSVLMAEEALAKTGDSELAAFCLLHDGHEFALGDLTSPGVRAVYDRMIRNGTDAGLHDMIAEAQARRYKTALQDEKASIDEAIITAAGLDFQRFLARHDEIHAYDMQALLTERRDLMAKPAQPWDEEGNARALPPRKQRIKPWSWPTAEERFRDALTRLCPAVARANPRAA